MKGGVLKVSLLDGVLVVCIIFFGIWVILLRIVFVLLWKIFLVGVKVKLWFVWLKRGVLIFCLSVVICWFRVGCDMFSFLVMCDRLLSFVVFRKYFYFLRFIVFFCERYNV